MTQRNKLTSPICHYYMSLHQTFSSSPPLSILTAALSLSLSAPQDEQRQLEMLKIVIDVLRDRMTAEHTDGF